MSRRSDLPTVPEASVRLGFEPRDAPPRGVVYAILGLFAGIGLSAGFVAGLLAVFVHFREPGHPMAPEAPPQAQSQPRLALSPQADRAAIEAAARRKLEGYAWTDRAAQRVHIPIDRALRITAERGWPDADGGPPP